MPWNSVGGFTVSFFCVCIFCLGGKTRYMELGTPTPLPLMSCCGWSWAELAVKILGLEALGATAKAEKGVDALGSLTS